MATTAIVKLSNLTSASTVHLEPSAFASVLEKQNFQIISHPVFSSDPVASLRSAVLSAKETNNIRPVSLLADAYTHTLAKISTSFNKLNNLAVVLNLVAHDGDYSPLDIFRSTSIPILHSPDANTAVENSLVASRLAVALRTPIIHVVDASNTSSPSSLSYDINVLDPAKVSSWISNGQQQQEKELSVDQAINQAFSSLNEILPSSSPSSNTPFRYQGPPTPKSLVLAFSAQEPLNLMASSLAQNNTGILQIIQYRPLDLVKLSQAIPSSVTDILTLDQAYTRTTKWSSLYLDVLSALSQDSSRESLPNISSASVGIVTKESAVADANSIIKALSTPSTSHFLVGKRADSNTTQESPKLHIPNHEQAYYKVLESVLPGRLNIVNSPENVAPPSFTSGVSPASPEFALGRVLAEQDGRKQLSAAVKSLFTDAQAKAQLESQPSLTSVLTSWLEKPESTSFDSIKKELDSVPKSITAFKRVFELAQHFNSKSSWIVGSEAWSHDLGNSGVHHAIASGANINMLVIDSTPYDPDLGIDPDHKKKDIGLYAMNYGNAYVASVALYADYGQAVRSFMEADNFKGPSIVLAYLPGGTNDSVQALQVLKQTKQAIDSGFWPLYRWNPALESTTSSEDVFQLDSIKIKKDLGDFLDRQSHLTQLSSREPKFDQSLDDSPAKNVAKERESRAKAAFDKLATAISGPPLAILCASDGGNAEKLAKRLTARAKARGLGARSYTMDEFSLDDLALEPNVVFVTSTAGQGEFPQNGRNLWKALSAKSDQKLLENIQYSVFGLGDSHYWPRAEDAHYYNKPGKDLDKKLQQLGAQVMTDIGLGDDQDADGFQTGYKEWEPRLWKALGVGDVEIVEAEPEPITNEHIKIASNYLRGTIAEGLQDTSTGALAESDGQLTKFHGIYQQDDRDIRDQRKDQGLEPAYSFMVRVRMPGGVCRPEQWLQIDEIAGRRGNDTFKLTTRSTFQFHGIIKSNLKPAIQEINRALLDTVAACGDVNRNVTCAANPSLGKLHKQVYDMSIEISERLLPKTNAYAEIWLDKKMIAGDAVKNFSEPLYGKYYLPRKFKIGIAVPPSNDVDVFTNDVGLIAIVDEKTGDLQGFNMSIGGGMGVTHAMKKTYPRLGSIIGFVPPHEASNVCEKVMLVQRDNGDRANRKQARLKYTIDRLTLPVFKAEVEKRLGYKLEPAKPYHFDSNIDDFGWHVGHDGKHHFVTFIENGRVQDEPGKPFRTCLREIAKIHKGVFRLTANQHLIISDIPPEDKPAIEKLLRDHKLDVLDQSGLRKSSSACVAFPTCGLAMAESERYLPLLIDKVEKICEEAGLRNDAIVMRMTGCPNGCARPYAAEVAFVGKAPGQYLMLLGGGFYGQRLNKIYKESVDEEQIMEILTPMIKRYAKERNPGEPFGDWTIRAGYITAVESGAKWYEGMAPGDKA